MILFTCGNARKEDAVFDRNKFRGTVISAGKTMGDVARYLGINPATLTRKMDGTSDFTRSEIQLLRSYLSLSDESLNAIFFAKELT